MKLGFCKTLCVTLAGAALLASSAAAQEETKDSSWGVSLTPSVRRIMVKGDENKFREHWWMKDGWAEGIEEFTFEKKVKDYLVKFEGSTLINEQDHKLRLEVSKKDFGYLRAGFSNYRRYFDDTGGYYRRFNHSHTKSQDLDRKLHLDIGNVFVEAGLTIPAFPKIEIGYERQYKQGYKSMIEWGSVTQTVAGGLPTGAVQRKIFPARKKIDETVDIFKLNLEHDIADITFRDAFRYEKYHNSTKREDDSSRTFNAAGVTTATKDVTVKERFSHQALSNAFTLDSQPHEKVYWSAGYLYSKLWGEADYWMDTQPYNARRDRRWRTESVDLDQNTHAINLNLMLGPFANLTPYGGIQLEQTGTKAQSESIFQKRAAVLDTSPEGRAKTSNDKQMIESTLGLRYTGIPFTALYAEGRWRQEKNTLFERQLEEDSLAAGDAFVRKTDGDTSRQDYTIGFNTSPFRRVTWAGRYTLRLRENQHHHQEDQRARTTGLGTYPAFITEQHINTNELSTQLTVRPFARLSVMGKYQFTDTEIYTKTQRNDVLRIGDELRSGDYTSHRYSLSSTWTATEKLYLTGMVSYQNTQTQTGLSGVNSVIKYEGNVLSLVGTLGYAFDDKTDFKAQYVFSQADTFEDNGYSGNPPAGWVSDDYGLPMGTDYQQHGLTATLSRKINKYLTAGLRYGFYYYQNSANFHVDDYTAHLVGGYMTLKF